MILFKSPADHLCGVDQRAPHPVKVQIDKIGRYTEYLATDRNSSVPGNKRSQERLQEGR